ncbi:hypothetical protein Q5Y75_18895 [Ruegeria sp. 2205SS24-7]|uniref:hypothetical protein n=1 Tax=Ruegeria discodermiae TaxID=3064389 RepID=UPI0027410241|nr:hypothetical protein [Ruegeria sp. 2205SS24-7]MDP5219294.1 hypothetical protein [Ruegeria sp. 2205SS24-7]
MQIKSFLNRFKVAEPVQTSASNDADEANSDKKARVPLLQKSELTSLFQAVLDEKQRDLPLRRG